MTTVLLNAVEFTLPAFWRDYLINQDSSGISLKEKTEIDAWLKSTGMSFPVRLDGPWFSGRHDAGNGFVGMVAAFTFLK